MTPSLDTRLEHVRQLEAALDKAKQEIGLAVILANMISAECRAAGEGECLHTSKLRGHIDALDMAFLSRMAMAQENTKQITKKLKSKIVQHETNSGQYTRPTEGNNPLRS